MGELIEDPVEHPIIRPSINAVAETYDRAAREPDLASTMSPLTGERVNRFLHVASSREDLVMQNKMQRKMITLGAFSVLGNDRIRIVPA